MGEPLTLWQHGWMKTGSGLRLAIFCEGSGPSDAAFPDPVRALPAAEFDAKIALFDDINEERQNLLRQKFGVKLAEEQRDKALELLGKAREILVFMMYHACAGEDTSQKQTDEFDVTMNSADKVIEGIDSLIAPTKGKDPTIAGGGGS